MDTEDIPKLLEYNLKVHVSWKPKINGYYAEVCQYLGMENGKGTYKILGLHNIVMNEFENLVDHISFNTLDDRKSNLRVCEYVDNNKHRKTKNSNNTSGYRNVSWNKYANCWMVQLQIDGKNTRLKDFPENQLDEAGVYAEKMRNEIYGKFAGGN